MVKALITENRRGVILVFAIFVVVVVVVYPDRSCFFSSGCTFQLTQRSVFG